MIVAEAIAAPAGQSKEARLSSVIFDYVRRIGQLEHREALLEVITDMGRDLVQADRCSIWLLDPASGQLVTRVAHGGQAIRIEAGQGYVGRCIASGETVLCNRLEQAGSISHSVDARTGYRTENLLVVPMRGSRGEVIGAFQALNRSGGFSPEDADLLRLAATYSASTLEAQTLRAEAEEARKLERELEIARQVQQRLLPDGREFSFPAGTVYGTCRAASEVGGDYFAYFPSAARRLVIAAGDVSGKGISAALMMASIQATLHGLISATHYSLREIVERVNETVYETSLSNRYSTLCLMSFDPETKILTSVNAGHCPLILLHGDGRLSQIGSDGPPVGLLPGLRYGDQEHKLCSGDMVVCYSDGLSECHNRSQEIWPEEEFLEAMSQVSGSPVAEAAARLLAFADGFSDGAPPHDDMTIVCFRVR